MTWFEIVYESLQWMVIAYFASHAYRNSQDVSDLKAKMITIGGRFERLEVQQVGCNNRYGRLEADYSLAKRNGFYRTGQDSNKLSKESTK